MRQAEIVAHICEGIICSVKHIVAGVIRLVAEISGVVVFEQIKLV